MQGVARSQYLCYLARAPLFDSDMVDGNSIPWWMIGLVRAHAVDPQFFDDGKSIITQVIAALSNAHATII
jgi:hypothetical protein